MMRQHHGAERARRRGLGRGGDAGHHGAEHGDDDDDRRNEHGARQLQLLAQCRLVVDEQNTRAVLRANGAADDDVDDVGACQHEARDEHAEQDLADVCLRRRADDHGEHRRRNDGAERAAGADHAGDEPLVVAVAQHGRDRQQPDHGLGGADHAAGRRKDHAHQDGADGHASGQAPDPHLDRIEQAVGDAGLLEHGAHEDEQRHGGEHLRGGRLLDLLDALVQQAFEAERMQAEDHRQRQHGEGDGKPGQDGEKERREHPER